MKNKQDPFEKRIRERLQSLEAEPAGDAWDRIADDLTPAPSSGYRYGLALLILLLALVGGTVWWASIDPPKNNAASSSKRDSSDAAMLSSRPSHLSEHPPTSEEKTTISESPSSRTESPSSQAARQTWQESSDNDTIQTPSYQKKKMTLGKEKSKPSDQAPPVSEPTFQPEDSSPTDRHPRKSAKRPTKTNARSLMPVASVESNRPAITDSLPEIVLYPVPAALLLPSLPQPEAVVAEASRWEVWVTASPLLLYQRVVPNPSDTVYITSLDRSTFSKDRWGAQLRIGGRYALNERWAAKVGVYYRYTRDQWTYRYRENLTDTFEIVRTDDNTVEARPVYEEQTGTIRQTHHNLGGLVGVQYRLSNRWNSNLIGVELQAHPQQGQLAWYAHSSYVAEKALNDHWSVSGGLNFLWNLSSPETQSDYFQLKPYGFGAQVGVSYKLRLGR